MKQSYLKVLEELTAYIRLLELFWQEESYVFMATLINVRDRHDRERIHGTIMDEF